jgi:hypothetical protein
MEVQVQVPYQTVTVTVIILVQPDRISKNAENSINRAPPGRTRGSDVVNY